MLLALQITLIVVMCVLAFPVFVWKAFALSRRRRGNENADQVQHCRPATRRGACCCMPAVPDVLCVFQMPACVFLGPVHASSLAVPVCMSQDFLLNLVIALCDIGSAGLVVVLFVVSVYYLILYKPQNVSS